MKDTLDTLIHEAFSVAGEASPEYLKLALRQHQRTRREPARRAVVAVCAMLLLTASAVTAKAILGYEFLFKDGRLVGTLSKQGRGTYILNLDKTRLTKDGSPVTLEVRDKSGKVLGMMSIGPVRAPQPKKTDRKKETK